MFSKVLVAKPGEIAIQAIRAAYELGAQTVAVSPHDRGSEHRLKAEEAYEIGERCHPVRAYLDPRASSHRGEGRRRRGLPRLRVPVREAAPGRGVRQRRITFTGTTAEVLTLTGNKARAIAATGAAGVPTLESVEPGTDVDPLVASIEGIPYPLFVKGGGRRPPWDASRRQAREAAGGHRGLHARGRERVRRPDGVLEQAVVDLCHIEVQVLSDGTGGEDGVIHLFERDCSVQRPHQKVVEIAPAPNLAPELRDRICADAVGWRGRSPTARGHRRVPDNAGRQLRVRRDEPADPSGAHGDRGGHRCRPWSAPRCGSRSAIRWPTRGWLRTPSRCAARRCSAGSRPRTRRTTSRCRPRTAPGGSCSRSAPRGSPRRCGSSGPVAVTNMTFHDAHHSLLANRVRTRDMLDVAGHLARMTPGLWSLEAWGRATYDVALRYPVRGPVGAAG